MPRDENILKTNFELNNSTIKRHAFAFNNEENIPQTLGEKETKKPSKLDTCTILSWAILLILLHLREMSRERFVN